MPRPRVILPLLFAFLVTVVGLRPRVVVLRSVDRDARPSHAAKPDWLPGGLQRRAIAVTTSPAALIPKQLWNQNPPSGQPGVASGIPTFPATPPALSHAQFMGLTWLPPPAQSTGR